MCRYAFVVLGCGLVVYFVCTKVLEDIETKSKDVEPNKQDKEKEEELTILEVLHS